MPANRFYSTFDFETLDPRPSHAGEYRNPFQIDRDRIIHSSAFRRLQNKTQVFLSGEYDFYRTRLTHSIEVAQIGRSICAWLTQQSDALGDDCFIDPDLVESACLSHDLGHPPFGHAGERTLHKLMQPYGGFEGNAQTLRILTQTLFSEGRSGMNPTRALLDGVLKYKTIFTEKPANKANQYLYDDQDKWLDFTMGRQAFPAELTPGKARNSFKSIECQIMDWADDTAYSLNDIADGIHAGFVNVQRLERWVEEQTLSDDDKADVAFLSKAMRENRVEGRLNRLIGECIRATKLVPTANFLSQSTRRHQFALEIDPVQRRRADLHKKIALDLVFLSPQLQQLDHKADFILTRLFEVLKDRYIESVQPKGLHLMPAAIEKEIQKAESANERARLVCDWIANMTDHFAFRTYRRLFDADFGSITDFV
ncbi:dGTP triphosphohydrolase [Prosthecobacter sp.]|uniref:dGTP triphosphohydrolase n=1 Tax=Prosthecobacter sp. TaxID=1965333 RepID=UPI002ABA8284|nr:dNTP triphosphohydrolase [Prosthecobacter sp.]MDZ4406188.1 dNTP triphosphohydrolase [Prosthecobacter sp.]